MSGLDASLRALRWWFDIAPSGIAVLAADPIGHSIYPSYSTHFLSRGMSHVRSAACSNGGVSVLSMRLSNFPSSESGIAKVCFGVNLYVHVN